jgi:D-arginine dehydrogenase
MQKTDFLVIGAGIAGVSVAARLSKSASVRLLDMESQPGYHATGRSAAVYAPDYGNSFVRAMTAASKDFFLNPDPQETEVELFSPRDRLFVGREAHLLKLKEELQEKLSNPEDALLWMSTEEVCARFPILSPDYVAGALLGSGSGDLDVDAVLQLFLRRFKKQGGILENSAKVERLDFSSGEWRADTLGGQYSADVVVNAAGAWADTISEMAGAQVLGLSALRRTAILVPEPEGHSMANHPMVIDADENFYFKPDAGAVLISPADETLTVPCDAQAEELDIAIAVDEFEKCTAIKIARVTHSWAGLRTFAPDRTPVAGYGEGVDGFFILAGQGGYGVQTAPAMSAIAVSIMLGNTDAIDALNFGDMDMEILQQALSPQRFKQRVSSGRGV